MNKQEAIEKLKEESWEREGVYDRVTPVIDLDGAQEIVSQIHEPQKPVMPKFRVWEPYYKKMFANDQIIIWDGNVYANDADKITVDNMKGWSIDDKYLMQSTGLFDVNGKEIFEGDIVKVMDMTLAVVKYSKARGAYYLDCGNKIGDAGLICQYDTIEVLGNIFENPESMEDMQ